MPTQESLDEAAKMSGYVYRPELDPQILELITAHAETLDKLHGRKEVSEAERFYRKLMAASLGWREDAFLLSGDFKAITLIEAKFAELRQEYIRDMVAPKPTGNGNPSVALEPKCLCGRVIRLEEINVRPSAPAEPDGHWSGDKDDWIEWHGGECPVDPDTRVEVKFRDGEIAVRWGSTCDWLHEPNPKSRISESDIIAYRIMH